MSGERGMTLIEVMVTVLIIGMASIATMGTYLHFTSATDVAKKRAVLNSVAQRELERLRPVGYDQLGLLTPPTAQAATEAPLTGAAASEAPVIGQGGIVRPGGDEFTYDGVRMRLYRYVTYREPTCEALTAKVRTQLATRFGVTEAQLQAAITDACALGLSTTKRITVVAVPVDNGGNASSGVALSTLKHDPDRLSVLDVPASALAVKPVTEVLTGGSGAPSPPPVQTQAVTLLDTRCSDVTRDPPSDHETRDTAQAGFTCSESGPAPKLMTLAGVPGSESDPVPDFSTDVTRAAVGGLAVLRDTRAGSCSASDNLVYQNAEAADRMHSIHKWATTDPANDMVIPAGGGRASLTLYASTADGNPGPARLCATLQTETGAILGSTSFSLGSWPGKVTELTTAFDLAGGTIPAGQRLILTLRVPGDSGEDLRILYDHPAYQSSLAFTTETGRGLG
jgi:prepilin-type N-terminal cleavage/methylation domain-containing protein